MNEIESIVNRDLLFDFYGDLLTEHQKRIFEAVVFDDRSISEVAREEGIISDPTYTGKTFRGLLDMIDKGIITEDTIFLHTGGAMAVWTKEHLDDMQQELFDNCKISEI